MTLNFVMKDNNNPITFLLSDNNNYSRLHSSNEVKHFYVHFIECTLFWCYLWLSLSLISQRCSSGNKCQSLLGEAASTGTPACDRGCSGAELGQFSVWRSGIELYFLPNCWCRNYGLSSLSVNYKWTSKLRLILFKHNY